MSRGSERAAKERADWRGYGNPQWDQRLRMSRFPPFRWIGTAYLFVVVMIGMKLGQHR